MLVKSDLEAGLLAVFKKPATDTASAISATVDAYVSYAQKGTFSGTLITSLAPQSLSLKGLLIKAVKSRTLEGYAMAWGSGLATFWVGVPTMSPVLSSMTGLTTSCPGAASVPGSFTSLAAAPPKNGAEAANYLANVLHTATKTVMATITVVSAPPVVTPLVPIA